MIFLALLLSFNSIKTLRKGKSKYHAETEAFAKAAKEALKHEEEEEKEQGGTPFYIFIWKYLLLVEILIPKRWLEYLSVISGLWLKLCMCMLSVMLSNISLDDVVAVLVMMTMVATGGHLELTALAKSQHEANLAAVAEAEQELKHFLAHDAGLSVSCVI
jgi:hypothetical protein